MSKHRVRLTLSGSRHNYERSCPVNSRAQCVSDGMTAFQVSTGGIGLRDNGSFSWSFVPTSGRGKDAGARSGP
jgi:hypothetical protein